MERVRAFYKLYPRSDFLKTLVEPLREVQSKHLDNYFRQNDQYSALDFFEKTREFLFPKVKQETRAKLFSQPMPMFISQTKPLSLSKVQKEVVISTLFEGPWYSLRLPMMASMRLKNRQLAKRLVSRDWVIQPWTRGEAICRPYSFGKERASSL